MNKLEVAGTNIEDFVEDFGEAHFYFVMHASLPAVLTSDLLHSIRQNFAYEMGKNKILFPWEAVADIVLSPLCCMIAYGIYEMDLDVRKILLDKLKHHEAFGQNRINELSLFLRNQIEQLQFSVTRLDQRMYQSQTWAANVFQDPASVVKDLTQLLPKRKEDYAKISRSIKNISELSEFFIAVTDDESAGFENLIRSSETIIEFISDNTNTNLQATTVNEQPVLLPVTEQLEQTATPQYTAETIKLAYEEKFPELSEVLRAARLNKSTVLNLRNQLSNRTMPEELYRLEWLEELNLSDNNLLSLPREIANLTRLKKLDVSNNELFDIHPIQNMALTFLDLSSNPNIMGYAPVSIPTLKELYLNQNNLRSLDFLLNLENLETLDASYNNINELQPISKLNKLSVLDLGHNQIEDISSLQYLNQLQNLYLNNNRIKDISPLAGLTLLSNLDLRFNYIGSGVHVKQLIENSALEKILLFNNPLQDIPADIRPLKSDENSLVPLRNYFRSQVEEGRIGASAGELINAGNDLFKNKNYESALEHFQRAALLYPDNIDALLGIADCYTGLLEYKKAIQSIRKAININHSHYIAYIKLGFNFVYTRTYLDAIESFYKAISLEPSASKAFEGLGDACMHINRYEEAMLAYEQSLALNKTSYQTCTSLGKCLLDMGLVEKGIIRLQEAINLDPLAFEAHELLINHYLQINDPHRAQSFLDQVQHKLSIHFDNYDIYRDKIALLQAAIDKSFHNNRGHLPPSIYDRLMDVLPSLFPTRTETIHLLSSAGIDPINIKFASRLYERWTEIFEYVANMNKLKELLQAVQMRFPDRKNVQELLEEVTVWENKKESSTFTAPNVSKEPNFPPLKVYLSYSLLHLSEYRKVIVNRISELGMIVIRMDDYDIMDIRLQKAIVLDIREADIFIGIYGNRYGMVNPATGMSIMEMEYREAKAGNKLIFIYMQSDEIPANNDNVNSDPEYSKLQLFKNELIKNYNVEHFSNVNDLEVYVSVSLQRFMEKYLQNLP